MAVDIILGDEFDPVIENGDFKADSSEEQEIRLLLTSNKGEYRQNPTVGADIVKLNHSLFYPEALNKAIRQTLKIDGFDTIDVEISSSNDVRVNAFRNGNG